MSMPDLMQVERVKAYVVLRDPSQATHETETAQIAHCRERLIKWSCPREIEFRAELPKTRIGKLDYGAQVEDHAARHAAVEASR